jgi:hypothetical protein
MAIRASWRNVAVVAALAAAALLVATPSGFGVSTGATKETIPDAAFAQFACTACHGPAKEFLPVESTITLRLRDAEGAYLNGPYEPNTAYTITISFQETVATDGGSNGNHAGFNLRATAGKLAGVEGESQATADGAEATHVNARRTSWNVTWTAPAEGPAAFQVFVNDVDGSGSPDEADTVLTGWFGVSDEANTPLGGAAKHEVHFGISLQQYWIGLIGLLGMIFIMVAGFVYLKFVNPHNTDAKDR